VIASNHCHELNVIAFYQQHALDLLGNWMGVVYAGLDRKNFIHENLFLSRIWPYREIFNPRKF
jgi:hypothetical protein